MDSNGKIFLSTGGSGGHIFPAVAVAQKLKSNEFEPFIISDEVYKKYSNMYDLEYKIISSSKTIKTFKGICNIVKGFFQSFFFIIKHKPKLVIAFGGYSSLPLLLASLFTFTPFVLHEQNAYIGKINSIFCRFSKKLMTSFREIYGIRFEDMEKVVFTGNPVREEIKRLHDVEYDYHEDKFFILITGGSAGAKFFSEQLPKVFDRKHWDDVRKLFVCHQVRDEFVREVKNYYNDIGLKSEVSSFFNDMEYKLRECNLLIGRAGASTVCEIAIAGKPSILIPLSSRGNNRQDINALEFEKNGASIVVNEEEFEVKRFQEMLFDLVKDELKLTEMSSNARNLSVVNADENIVEVINGILENGRKK